MTLIDPTARVSPSANIGLDVQVGPFTIVHNNVFIGASSRIGAYCEIGVPTPLGDGSPLVIGRDSLVRSHSVFYESSSFGDGLTTGHRVVVREGTKAGVSFQIGTGTEIQGDCEIGDYVRFQSNIFVGKQTRIGSFVWVLPYVIFANDPTPPSDLLVGPTIEDYASIATGAIVLPGVRVSKSAVVAAGACVTKDVPEAMLVVGVPAAVVGPASDVKLRDGSNRSAYPWRTHFSRGYPDSIVKDWCE